MLVEVKPITRKSWHGKEGKESFSQPKVLEVLYNTQTGRYATGLTEEEVVKYGKLMGVDLSDKFDPTTPHPYWSSQAARIKLPNHTVIFDDEKPADFVKIKNLKVSQYVANSMQDYEKGLYPEATHVIFDESEVVRLNATKIQRKRECTKLILEMSLDEKTAIVQILSEKAVRGRSQDFIDVEIDRIIDEKPGDFIRIAKMDKQEMNIRATILDAIQRNVLTKEAGAIFYMGERISNDYESAVDWFKDPQNSKMKVSILEKLNK
jgi:hypothetical protein